MTLPSFLSFSTTAASNVDVNGTGILGSSPVNNFDNAMRELMAILRRDLDAGIAYTTKSGAYTAVLNDNNAYIRGTAAFTLSLTAAATLGANWHLYVFADGGDITIDPNGSETVNGATTAVIPQGFDGFLICDGSGFRLVSSGLQGAYGQCQLALSGGSLVLSRFNGKLLTINGVPQLVPLAGVTLAPTGLTASTNYYVYAYMASGTMTLEASTTANATDVVSGMQVKSGDVTRTYVGRAYVSTGPAFTDGNVISYFHTSAINLGVAAASTSLASIDYTGIPANVKRITVNFDGVSTTGGSNYLIQLGSGAVLTTGYNSAASLNADNSTSTSGFIVTANQSPSGVHSGAIILSLTRATSNIWTAMGILSSSTGTTGSQTSSGSVAVLAGVIDRVRITTVGGTDTFDEGNINITWEF